MKEKFINKINENSSVIRIVVSIIVIFTIVFGIFLANCNVPTGSMEPTIKTNSRIIADRLAYKKDEIKRKDIIVFKFPDNEKTNFIKRVIGLPGEVVTVVNGDTYINGKLLKESYLVNDHNGNYGPFYVPKNGDIVTIENPEYDDGKLISGNCYINGFQVGTVESAAQYDANDAVEIENDGFLDKYCDFDGQNYIVKKDCYFCMGDNRNYSDDARFWNNKYVTKDKVVGKMILNVSDGFKKV